jgi:CRP/FNR family transcriptional activator FtrB
LAAEQTIESLAAALPILGALGEESRGTLLRHAVQHSVAAGTVLFEQGEMPTFQHILIAGTVQLSGRSARGGEVLIEVVRPPDLIIPAAVAMDAPYLMQASVPEPSRLMLIEAAVFRRVAATDPRLAQAVIRSLSGQFRRVVRQIKNLKLRSAAERVGCYLLALAARQGTPDRVRLPYEKNLIASELGITRESFSRALSALEADGIRVDGQTILILDPGRLAAACRPDPLIDGEDAAAPAIG